MLRCVCVRCGLVRPLLTVPKIERPLISEHVLVHSRPSFVTLLTPLYHRRTTLTSPRLAWSGRECNRAHRSAVRIASVMSISKLFGSGVHGVPIYSTMLLFTEVSALIRSAIKHS